MKRCLLALIVLVACRPEVEFDPIAHQAEVEKWKSERDGRLRQEDGWLTLVGLHWLEKGPNTIGSADTNAIVLPANAPALLGTLTLADGTVTLAPAPDAELTIRGEPVTGQVELRDDNDNDGPTLVHAGSLNFQVIKRGDRFGVRVKDPKAETLAKFEGLDYFPVDARWRIVAQFEPYQPARRIPITDITGMVSNSSVPGALVFDVDGETYRLDAIAEEGSRQLFVIFKDETSRDATYPAGRYLYVPRPGVDGKIVVDFNKAYSPPCAFTPFATCPLPPQQNRLPIRIEAGEKNYKAH